VAYELAALVGLNVPPFAFFRHPVTGRIFFASQGVRLRSAIDQLISQHGLVVNPDFFPTCIAFDVWISNRDRNSGNVVAEPVGGRHGSEIQLYAIDFEKSDILRGVSRFEITERYSPRNCRPVGELARFARGLPFPRNACTAISSITQDAIVAIFSELALNLPGHNIPWVDSASDFLARRAHRIEVLVKEAWDE
jgi:hypothetical protein